MKHTAYVLLCYDHSTFSAAKEAFVEVQAEDEQLLSKLAEAAKKKLCKRLNLPKKGVYIHNYKVYHELPMIITEEQTASAVGTTPTIHAHWKAVCDPNNPGKLPRYQCSHCQSYVEAGDDRNFCPSCGTRMNLKQP